MRKQLPKSIKRAYGDEAYDKESSYRVFYEADIKPIIMPQKMGF